MTDKEKAKAYDEAIRKAAILYKASEPMSACNVIIETIFPELKESDDETIRKELITYCRNIKCVTEEGAKKMAKWIAWLEKQGEPTEINPSEFDLRLNRLLKQFETLPKEELASSLSFYINVVQNSGTYKEEKQGKQKPAWSEDDERMYRGLHNLIYSTSYCDSRKELSDWLKSIKQRIGG